MPLLIALLLFVGTCFGQEQVPVDVFKNNTEGYNNYRIPSIVCTRSGILLAFAEGRVSMKDQAENDIVLKRSTDNGKSWNNLIVIDEDGRNALNNPQALVREDGRIILMYQRYADGYNERKTEAGLEGDKICRTRITYSDDDGLTWSTPKDITTQVKRAEVTTVASGPGIGFQLTKGKHKGRLIMPFNQGPWGNWYVYAVYSDDGGETWVKGEVAPLTRKSKGWPNEVQMVELSDGSLMLNARSERGNRKRKIAHSHDGGQTWSEVTDEIQLLDPQCQGSILSHDFKNKSDVLLFANPRHKSQRVQGTVYASMDDGKTWPHWKTVYEGGFAYSCLTILPNDEIGILFEKGDYKTISFITVSLEDVINILRE